MKKITLLSLLIIFCTSCGTANSRDNDYEAVYQRSLGETPSSSGNPDWVSSRKEKIDEGDRVAFIGSSVTKGTKKDAIDDATGTALNKIGRYFGVSVSAVFYHKDVQINGKYTEDISTDESTHTSKKIEVKEFDIEDSFLEHHGNGWVAHVKLTVPKTELARIQIEIDGFGVWTIKSDIPQCEEKIRDLFPVFSGYGVNINEQTDYSSKTPKQIFAENKKAFYLKIECKETRSEEYNGEFYSLLQISMELFNLLTGETVNRWNIETKGGAYSAKEAQEDAITKAVQEIAEQIK